MTLSWRSLRPSRHASKKHSRHVEACGDLDLTIPNHFRCPISLDLMTDPVALSTGITYDRQSIEKWTEAGNLTCPTTNQVLTSLEPIPNHTIRKMIQEWCVKNKSFGVERIPTPRVPVSSIEINDILSRVTSATAKKDQDKCVELVRKIEALTRESERNKRCVVANGAASTLAAAFNGFAATVEGIHQNVDVLGEIMSALTLTLTLTFPLDNAAQANLGSTCSLHGMMKLLNGGDLSQRRNTVLVLKEVVSFDKQKKTDSLEEIEGFLEALVKLIKEPICSSSTKAALVIIYHMLNTNVKERLIQMGLISTLSELVIDCDRSVCEKALAILDAIFTSKRGREEARNNALTMPVVVKKMLRVSDSSTEFSVSILWKLICNRVDEEVGGFVVEVLQVGAFQKLLLLLQVGRDERTKEKASELLKLLNMNRARLMECVDSMDFKQLKRAF